MAAYDAAMADFSAGRPAQIDESLPAPLQQVVLAITQPANQPFARELWVFIGGAPGQSFLFLS